MNSIKLPDEFLSGGEPLANADEEGIALGLFGLARWNAKELLSQKEFLDNLSSPPTDEKEVRRMVFEVIIFNLYITSVWMRGNYKNFQPVLDRMYFFLDKLCDNNVGLINQTIDHYKDYEEQYNNHAGAGPMFHIGLTATKYFYGTEDLTDKQAIFDPLGWAARVPEYAGLVKEFVEKKAYSDLAFMDLILKS